MRNLLPNVYGFTCIISIPSKCQNSRNFISRTICFADTQYSNAYQIET